MSDIRLTLSVFNCLVAIRINNTELSNILILVYGAMQVSGSNESAGHNDVDNNNIKLSYIITRNELNDEISICRDNGAEYFTTDIGEFIFLFEKDMTIELQIIRSDLLFIHSAVLNYKGQGLLLVAPSGTGKSTTSWAMLNSGFNYLSDELAPLDLDTMQVQAYPHALCLKAEPPVFSLPETSLYTSASIHVPVKSMPVNHHFESVKLSYIFYLEFDAELSEPLISPVSRAQATAQLFSNSLNSLAHDKGDSGMQAAMKVAAAVKNYSLKSNHLVKTCEKIRDLLES